MTFQDNIYEGRSEWVPASRLKVRWEDRDQFVEHENALDALARDSTIPEAIDSAARYVLDQYIGHDVAFLEYNYLIRDVLTIKQPQVLAAMAGVSDEDVLAGGFWDEAGYRVAWSQAERLILAIVCRYSDELSCRVLSDEEKARQEEVSGSILRGRGGKTDTFIEPDIVAENNNEFLWPMLKVVRGWLGIANPTPEVQMRVLREAGARAAYVAELAIGQLRDAGQEERAWNLHRMLFPAATKRSWRTSDEIKAQTRQGQEAEAIRLSLEWTAERQLEFDQRVADLRREFWG